MSDEVLHDLSDDDMLRASVATANIPTLLLLLVSLTGEMHWLEPPYQPARAKGLDDNDTGGLPDEVQHEIREAAAEAILRWRAGEPVAIPNPSKSLMIKMMSVAMAEEIPLEFADMMLAKLGIPDPDMPEEPPVDPPEGFHALIIGAGMSGIAAGVKLNELGVRYTIIEKNSDVGGVWRQNRYPGCGVDTPSHLYSYTFEPSDWTKFFSLRDEILEYFEKTANRNEVRPHIRFDTEVVSCVYDEGQQRWSTTVRTSDGGVEVVESNIVISAVGAFSRPKWPDIAGLDTFDGTVVHTAQWPEDLDLTGRRVALIGNGASAMQTVPAICEQVESLTVFQRSPQWAAPFEKFRKPVPQAERFLLQTVPLYKMWYRMRLGWIFDSKAHASLRKDPEWPHPERSLNAANDAQRRYLTRYIESELGDRQDLLPKVLPDYPPYGKRMLLDNGWFRSLTRDNVELVTERVDEIVPEGVRSGDGELHEAEVLIIATGFHVVHFLSSISEIRGRSGQALRDTWEDDNPRAYLGTAVPDFPNFFILYGPNTQAGHGGSLIFLIESQLQLIASALRQMFRSEIGAIEVREDVFERYNTEVDQTHEQMVWTHQGMSTYYRNSRGRVVLNTPFRIIDLWKRTRRADLDEFIVQGRRDLALASDGSDG